VIKIIDRYIFLELIEPFLFGLGAFTAILSCSMIMFELVRAVVINGMPLLVALQIFVYRLPGIIIYIFPMATLLAALLAFSRLSHDSEITAFKSSGISIFRLIVPVIFLGLLVSFANLVFSEIVVPEANRAAKNLVIGQATNRAPKLQKNVFLPELQQGELKRIFYAETMEGGKLKGVVIQEFSSGKLAQIINADEALWNKDNNQWLFKKGTVYIIAPTGEYKHTIKFEEQFVTIKYSPADFDIGDKNPDDMNYNELKEFISLKEKMGVDVVDFKIRLYMKTAIPFASLVFAVLGAPLGLSPRRTSGSMGLGVSILVIFFYYISTFISISFGEMGALSPFFAAWFPNFITGGVGWYILRKAADK